MRIPPELDGFAHDRRKFIGACVSGIAVLSGCLGGVNSAGDPNDKDSNDTNEKLGSVLIDNHHKEEHTVSVFIQRDDAIVYWNSFTLAGSSEDKVASTRISPPTIDPISGDWFIGAHIDGISSGKIWDVGSNVQQDCYEIVVRVNENGMIEFLTGRKNYCK